jgi:hypothetical protein
MRQINGIMDYEKPDIANMAGVQTADFTNATAVLLDITGLSIPLMGDSTYEFEALLIGAVSADVNGAEFAVDFDGAAGAVVEAIMIGALTNAACIAERITTIATATTPILTTASQAGGILIKGVIVTDADLGNLTIMVSHPTAGTTTIRIGSFLKTRKLE